MGYYPSLREYVQTLESRGKLFRIEREVCRETELHPLVRWQFRGLPENERRAFLFAKVSSVAGRKYKMSVLSGACASSRSIYAIKMRFLYSLVVCWLGLVGSDLSLVHAQKLEKLVIGYPAPVASLGIIDVMRKGGLFKKNGLEVDLVYIQGSPILTTAMVSGQVPMAFLGGAALIASAVGGADTVYLACGINTLYWRFFTTPDIKTIADLKGKKLGVTTIGSQEDSVIRYILRERGLVADRDFAVVAVGGAPTRLAALSKGVIHGSTFIPPQDIAAERLGLHPLIDMSKLGLYNPGSCFASTKTFIKTNRDTVMKVMKTFVEGLKYYKENREFVLKVTADFAQNRDPNVLNPTYEVVTRYQDRVPYVNMKGVEFMLKTLESRDARAKTFDPNTVVDSSFIQELEKTGFIDSVWKK